MTDLRLAIRLCFRHPLLSLAAIASLALGIGANTAIFTVLNGSVLKPLAYADPAGLMVVWETRSDTPKRSVAPANFLDWRRETTAFSGLAAFDDFTATLMGTAEAQRIHAVSASANFFEVLGVQAQVGRLMTQDDDRPDAPRVAVLTDDVWHQQFGASSDALGKTMILNSTPHTIVGVLPRGFEMPMVAGAEVWITGDRGIPRSFPFPGDITSVRDSHIIYVIGRLNAGAAREQAQAQLTSVMASLSQRYPSTNSGLGASVVPLHEEIVGDVRPLDRPAADRGCGAVADRVRECRAPAAGPGGDTAGGDLDALRARRGSTPDREATADRDVDHRGAGRYRRPGAGGRRACARWCGPRRRTCRGSLRSRSTRPCWSSRWR